MKLYCYSATNDAFNREEVMKLQDIYEKIFGPYYARPKHFGHIHLVQDRSVSETPKPSPTEIRDAMINNKFVYLK